MNPRKHKILLLYQLFIALIAFNFNSAAIV